MRSRSSLFIFTFALLTFILSNFFSKSFPVFYFGHIYQNLRWIYAHTIYHISFPFTYIILPILIGLLIFFGWKNIKRSMKDFAYFFLKTIALVYVSFNWLWGFNYHLDNISTRLALPNIPIDSFKLQDEIQNVRQSIVKIRGELSSDTSALIYQINWQELNDQIYNKEKEFANKMGYPAKMPIHIRKLKPDGTLLIFSTTGIYNPYSLEGHVDGGVFHLNFPFTMAHELGHGLGITDEGDCNFIALLTTLGSENKYIQYSGLFSYYRYLMRDLNFISPEMFECEKEMIPKSLKNDLKKHYEILDEYPEVFPVIRDMIYDYYLKSNGVESGLLSYDKVVKLSFSYQNKFGKFQFP
jgi:hypothetical protein